MDKDPMTKLEAEMIFAYEKDSARKATPPPGKVEKRKWIHVRVSDSIYREIEEESRRVYEGNVSMVIRSFFDRMWRLYKEKVAGGG